MNIALFDVGYRTKEKGEYRENIQMNRINAVGRFSIDATILENNILQSTLDVYGIF